jgi:hypothetical protein
VRRALVLVLGTVVAAMLLPPAGRVRALAASSFDWSVVPARIAINIQHGALSRATPGEIWLDADLLDSGVFAWGVVQHEFAHQVDFFLLTGPARALLLRGLGANVWCADGGQRRSRLGCERFASMLAWAYWPSPDNCMRPADASAASVRRFRTLVSSVIPSGVEH